jgi:hypothetical protein
MNWRRIVIQLDDEIGFELIGRAQKPISSRCLLYLLLLHNAVSGEAKPVLLSLKPEQALLLPTSIRDYPQYQTT